MRKPFAVPAVAVGLALATAACGSSGSTKAASSSGSSGTTTAAASSGTSGAAMTKPALVSKAEGVCKAATAQLGNPPGDPSAVTASDLPAWSTFLQKAESIGTNLVSQLKGLTPPSADQATYSDIVQKEQAALTDIQSAQQSAAAGDLTAFKSGVQKSSQSSTTATQAATAYGMPDC